jgi:putative colanic acid biosynthesis acetyltransferase WcaF
MKLLRRLFWRHVGRTLFRLSPHPAYGFRRLLLRMAGMRFGSNVRVRRSAQITRPWNVHVGSLTMIGDDVLVRAESPINIGCRCVISQFCLLLTATHDRTSSPIIIGDDCWVATDTLILPGAVLEDGVVVGARAMVDGRLPAWQISTGEPAAPRGPRVLACDA